MIDTVTESSTAYRVLQPPALVNQYAAMPSLHLGWNLLVGIAIVTTATRLGLKVIGLVLPVLMAIAVIVTANHDVLDVVAGLIFVLLGHAAALALDRRRSRGVDDPGSPDPEPRDIVRRDDHGGSASPYAALMNVLAIAHRAGNSLTELRQAAALGVDAIECNVHERGRLEVRHLKTAGPLPFLWDR